MPKLWTETIATHRSEVRDAVVEAAARLVHERGLRGVTMAEIAKEARIGRATLYKYFPDVESILGAWHERHVAGHLAELEAMRDGPGKPRDRLRAILEGYARVQHASHASELASMLHRGEHVATARRRLVELVAAVIAECVRAGDARADAPPDELARFCVHALEAASELRSNAAIERLVSVTASALAPSRRQ